MLTATLGRAESVPHLHAETWVAADKRMGKIGTCPCETPTGADE